MHRISRPAMFMQVAHVFEQRATCMRGSVGALVTAHHRDIISYGYNGSGPGEPHCSGNGCPGALNGCVRSLHAEANAIERIPKAYRLGFADHSTLDLYVTSSPCLACLRKAKEARIARVFYENLYRVNDHLDWSEFAEVELFKITPSGYIINHRTRELLEIA